MDEEKKIAQLKNQGWQEMSDLLDAHMPVRKDRPLLFWYRLAGAAAIILLAIIAWPYLSPEDSTRLPVESGTQSISEVARPGSGTESRTGKKNEGIAARKEVKGSSETAPFQAGDSDASLLAIQSATAPRTSNPDTRPIPGAINAGTLESRSETLENVRTRIPVNEAKSEVPGRQYDMKNDPFVVPVLSLREINVSPGLDQLHPMFLAHAEPVTISHTGNRFGFVVFSEMMWSLSDQFGFLNAGPGIQYQMDKITLGLSAGASIPVPSEKAFSSSNQYFQKQYNFDKYLNSDYSYASGSAESSKVYYENYTIKTGLMLAVSADIRLSPRWSMGMMVGWNRFQWEFTQRAVPNQNVAANTDLADLRNNLWYGGFEAGYAVSPHWKAKAGVRFINPGDPQNIGILPAVRLQYEF